MKSEVLYESADLKYVVFGRDENKRQDLIDTNQFAIIASGGTLLPDPGGIEVFAAFLSELTRYTSTEDISEIFSSHQDPDVISSLAMWLDLCPNVNIYISKLWYTFIAHFKMGSALEVENIPDEGTQIPIGSSGRFTEAIPAHYCHSSGNFSLFEPESRILMSGDIGAALLPPGQHSIFVEDFNQHVQYMRGFHLRWMPANKPLRNWVKRVRALEPTMIAPQHGSIFKGADVERLLSWLEELDVEAADPAQG